MPAECRFCHFSRFARQRRCCRRGCRSLSRMPGGAIGHRSGHGSPLMATACQADGAGDHAAASTPCHLRPRPPATTGLTSAPRQRRIAAKKRTIDLGSDGPWESFGGHNPGSPPICDSSRHDFMGLLRLMDCWMALSGCCLWPVACAVRSVRLRLPEWCAMWAGCSETCPDTLACRPAAPTRSTR